MYCTDSDAYNHGPMMRLYLDHHYIHPFFPLNFSHTFHHEIQDDSQQEPPDEIEDPGLDIGRMTIVAMA
jgi:hypothetical protein